MSKKKIFISYKRENLNKVRAIVEEIKAETGADCWVDLTGIESVDYFRNVIIKAINDCEHFIFMLSKESEKTEIGAETLPKMEINFAKQKEKKITIVSIDGIMIDENDLLKFDYGGLNIINYSNPDQKEVFFNDIRRHFGTQKPDNQTEETPKKQEETPTAQQLYEKGKAEYDRKNYAEAVKWYRKAAEMGHAEAQFEFGYCCYLGLGVAQDYTEAVKWYRKAAEQGYAEAQFWLGDCYYLGEGVVEDSSEAVKLYRKAAEQGHTNAQYKLGKCYYYGEGVARDISEMVKWYRKAAEQGHEAAKNQLKKIPFWKR